MRRPTVPFRVLSAFAAAFVVSVMADPARADVVGSDRLVEETRVVGDFTGISVAAGILVKVEAGDRSAIALRGEDNVLPHVRTEIKGSTLEIGFERNLRISTRQPVTIALRVPRLDELSTSGGSQLDASTPSGGSLRVSASGGSRIHLTASVKPRRLEIDGSGASEIAIDEVDAAEARIGASGSSTVTVAGNAKALDLRMSGSSRLEGSKLTAGALAVDGSGGSRARVRVVGAVQGALSGGTTLHVGNEAAVDVNASGGSQVVRKL
jgi:hypothetical protein